MKYIFSFIVFHLLLFSGILQAQTCVPDPNSRLEITQISEPYQIVCHIVVKRKWHSYPATASFISPHILVGAGHSLRQKKINAIKGITIIPCQHYENGKVVAPYGCFYYTVAQLKDINAETGFTNQPEKDWGYVVLPDNKIYEQLGSPPVFNLVPLHEIQNKIDSIFIPGYPKDKEYGSLWSSGDRFSNAVVEPEIMKYSIYTQEGNSGSPVWCQINNKLYIIGIHNTGHYHNNCNAAAIFTGSRIDFLNNLMRKYP